MKQLLRLLFFSLAACTSSQQQDENANDSIRADADSITTTPSTTTADHAVMAFGIPITRIIEKAYAPDQWVNPDEKLTSPGQYTVETLELVEGEFTNGKGNCSDPGVVVFCHRTIYKTQEENGGQEDDGDEWFGIQYSFFTVIKKSDSVEISHRVDYNRPDDSFANGSVIKLDQVGFSACGTLSVEYESSGGDELPWSDKITTFFYFDGLEFKPLLEIETEKIYSTRNFEGGENPSFTDGKYWEFVDKEEPNGLNPVRMHFTRSITNGQPTDEGEEFYYFDGAKYTLRSDN